MKKKEVKALTKKSIVKSLSLKEAKKLLTKLAALRVKVPGWEDTWKNHQAREKAFKWNNFLSDRELKVEKVMTKNLLALKSPKQK